MKLKYFKEKAYNELYDSISENIGKYTVNNPVWIEEFLGKECFKESKINAVLPDLYGARFEDDIVNVRLVYDSLKDVLTPKQASNELLWSYLAHTKYWEYTLQRWGKGGFTEETIKDRFFCGHTKSGKADRRGLLRNSISRLYWYGYLTYQNQNTSRNKYELTEILLSKADLTLNLAERSYSMNHSIISGILKAIQEYNYNVERGISEDQWRDLSKYINRSGAVMLLDMMSEQEVESMAYSYLIKDNK